MFTKSETIHELHTRHAESQSDPFITSQARCFQTVELLEKVLLYLNTREIVIASRVCRDFQACIAGSMSVRRKLFIEAKRHETFSSSDENPDACNDGKIRICLPIGTDLDSARAPNESARLYEVNTCFFEVPRTNRIRQLALLTNKLSSSVLMLWLPQSEYNGSTPSWHKMFPTNPPPRCIALRLYYKGLTSFEESKDFFLENKFGVTLGQILHVMQNCHVNHEPRWAAKPIYLISARVEILR